MKLSLKTIVIGLCIILFIVWWFSLPKPLFNAPLSTVVWSKEHKLLGARVASDGQWRFPSNTQIPHKFKQCIIYFEDEYFEYHPGFNPVSITKALWNNITSDNKRGGSTITQQVIRLSRLHKSRTYTEKIIELFLATRLEVKFSKSEILNLYTTYAPFGGNVVGLETASWRYFNLPAKDLSWSQSAALAVLPNAPSLVFPGRNEDVLRGKRDKLLQKLLRNNIIDSTTYKLALLEDLPGKAVTLPNHTPHLVEWLRTKASTSQFLTTIDYDKQLQVNNTVQKYLNIWKNNQIYNAAVLVVDVNSGQILSYTANSIDDKSPYYHVDMIKSQRSTGSLLKPILYASLLNEGELLPQQLIKDIPSRFNNYMPQNFTREFQGMIPADQFVQQSLNVPAVRLLQYYGIDRFLNRLKELELRGINQSAGHYGLPLILGGAESSLWDLTKMYTHLAQKLKFSKTIDDRAYQYSGLKIIDKSQQNKIKSTLKSRLKPSSIYNMFEAMSGLERPGLDAGWKAYANSRKIAWKTGTSYGYKDAWSIGVTPEYVVGVWVGNADGTGRPNLVGVNAAAPLMFSVFQNLPTTNTWFQEPFSDYKTIRVCKETGYIKSLNCPTTKEIKIPDVFLKLKPCPYHQTISLTKDENFQLISTCHYTGKQITKQWLVFPPIVEYYYKKNHPEYRSLPDFHSSCSMSSSINIGIIYPSQGQNIILPKTFAGEASKVVLEAAYSTDKILYWHIDDTFVGSTRYFHEMQLQPEEGEHTLTLVSEDGSKVQRSFSVSYTN